MKEIAEIENLSKRLLQKPNYAFPAGCDSGEKRSAHVLHRALLEDFQRLCPQEFQRQFDGRQVSSPEPLAAAWSWRPGSYPGLWIHSAETGRGKTRFAWLKFGQAMLDYRIRPMLMTGVQLNDHHHEIRWSGRPTQFHACFERRQLVILDDLDKFLLQDDKAALALRELFDHFYRQHISVLVTANLPPDQFAAVIGESALRRIQTVCEVIRF